MDAIVSVASGEIVPGHFWVAVPINPEQSGPDPKCTWPEPGDEVENETVKEADIPPPDAVNS